MNRPIDTASVVKAIIVAVVAAIGVGACSSNGGPTDLSESTKARLADYCAKRDACQAELGSPSARVRPACVLRVRQRKRR
jgi:hypothetical protein